MDRIPKNSDFVRNLPHDSIHHFHDDFIDDLEELNDGASTFPKGSKYSAKGQTKKDDS